MPAAKQVAAAWLAVDIVGPKTARPVGQFFAAMIASNCSTSSKVRQTNADVT